MKQVNSAFFNDKLTNENMNQTTDLTFFTVNLITSRPICYTTFVSCSTKLNKKFILLMNVNVPTIVGILTFISRKIAPSQSLKARKCFICHYFTFCEQLKIRAHFSMI